MKRAQKNDYSQEKERQREKKTRIEQYRRWCARFVEPFFHGTTRRSTLKTIWNTVGGKFGRNSLTSPFSANGFKVGERCCSSSKNPKNEKRMGRKERRLFSPSSWLPFPPGSSFRSLPGNFGNLCSFFARTRVSSVNTPTVRRLRLLLLFLFTFHSVHGHFKRRMLRVKSQFSDRIARRVWKDFDRKDIFVENLYTKLLEPNSNRNL